jgi:hypothetical protein
MMLGQILLQFQHETFDRKFHQNIQIQLNEKFLKDTYIYNKILNRKTICSLYASN